MTGARARWLVSRSSLALSMAIATGGCVSTTMQGGNVAGCGDSSVRETGEAPCAGSTFLSSFRSPIAIDIPDNKDGAPADRPEVLRQIEKTAPRLAASVSEKTPTKNRQEKPTEKQRGPSSRLSLADAVAIAVLSHPTIGAQAAKIRSAKADVAAAQAPTRPSLEVFAGTGASDFGNYRNYPYQFANFYAPLTARTDIGLTFRQLVYDFGAAEAEVSRTHALVDAERLKLDDQAEDIALRTANAYLNLLEQSELLSLIDKTIASQRSLMALVKLNEANGNGTQADVSRIQARVIETEAMRTDIDSAYHIALDEFHRLTNLEPRQVNRPTAPGAAVPKKLETAIEIAQTSNPSLLALEATGSSFNHALAELDAQSLPRIEMQGDSLVRHYVGAPSASLGIIDARAMLTVSVKLLDGGLLQSQVDRIVANRQANEFKQLDEKETIELNLRRFYQTMSAARTKHADTVQGVKTASDVNTLYIEQFKAGRRTVFEVLDSNMALFNMNRNRIGSEFEEMRAMYGVLRNMGRLAETISRS